MENDRNIQNSNEKEKPNIKENELTEPSNVFIPDEVLEAIPLEERGRVIRIMKQSMFSGVMRSGNPISEKITTEHITKLIDKSDNQDIRDREERKGQRPII
jgi:hypothetical protein